MIGRLRVLWERKVERSRRIAFFSSLQSVTRPLAVFSRVCVTTPMDSSTRPFWACGSTKPLLITSGGLSRAPFWALLLALTHDSRGRVRYAPPVHEEHPCWDGIDHPRLVTGRELYATAVLEDEDVLLWHPQAHGRLRVVLEVPKLTVHRDEEFGFQEREYKLLLLFSRVTRDVHVPQGSVENFGAPLHEVVDRARDTSFVSRNRGSGDDYNVAGSDL